VPTGTTSTAEPWARFFFPLDELLPAWSRLRHGSRSMGCRRRAFTERLVFVRGERELITGPLRTSSGNAIRLLRGTPSRLAWSARRRRPRSSCATYGPGVRVRKRWATSSSRSSGRSHRSRAIGASDWAGPLAGALCRHCTGGESRPTTLAPGLASRIVLPRAGAATTVPPPVSTARCRMERSVSGPGNAMCCCAGLAGRSRQPPVERREGRPLRAFRCSSIAWLPLTRVPACQFLPLLVVAPPRLVLLRATARS